MVVSDIVLYIFDKVCIYDSSDIENDLYKGNTKNIPQDILNETIMSIGTHNGVVEIEIKRNEQNEEDR